jgi:hypothetical protein
MRLRIVTIGAALVLVLAGCGGDDGGSGAPPPGPGVPSAADVADALEAGGLPLTVTFTDTSPVGDDDGRGIVSSGETGTDEVDLTVSIYETPAAREADLSTQAADAEESDVESVSAVAVCGAIAVDAGMDNPEPGEAEAMESVIAQTQRILVDAYGPC